MRRFAIRTLVPASLALMVTMAACDSNNGGTNLETITVSDVPADPPTGRDPTTGQAIGTTGKFTFYSLRENKIILTHTAADRSDSLSNKWDIAFHGSTIVVNAASVGGGTGGGQLLAQAFEDVKEAPSSGYNTSSMGLDSSPTPWGTYDAGAMTVFPLTGRTLVVRTGDSGGYAKVKILSYYKGAPEVPDPFQDQERYYTFEYVLQTDGRRFE